MSTHQLRERDKHNIILADCGKCPEGNGARLPDLHHLLLVAFKKKKKNSYLIISEFKLPLRVDGILG